MKRGWRLQQDHDNDPLKIPNELPQEAQAEAFAVAPTVP